MRLLLLLAVFVCVRGYNIVLYHDVGTGSHMQLHHPLARKLLDRGHKVTGIYYGASGIKHDNYTEILLHDIQKEHMKHLTTAYMGNTKASGLITYDILRRTYHLIPKFIGQMTDNLARKDVTAALNSKVDLVISSSSMGGLASYMADSKLIFLCPPGPFHVYNEMLGSWFSPSQSPALGVVFDQPEMFGQRLQNLMSSWVLYAWVHGFAHLMDRSAWQQPSLNYTGPGTIHEFRSRLTVILSNSNPVTHEPQPLLENIVHVGGFHLRKERRPLPADIQRFLDDSPQGVVLVAFGSSITPSSMSPEKKQEFFKAFEMLKLPVILKWDLDESEKIPNNVLVKNWLPQQDVLAHPNLKVFVTHGGMLSLMEAIYFNTRVIGIPLANDQRPNLSRMERKNIGIMMEWETITSDLLVRNINKAMADSGMTESMEKMSRLFREFASNPLDKAVWWIEFVIRNDGADFLKPLSLSQRWYEARNLDILFVLLLIISVSLFVSFKLLKLLYSCCCPSSRKTKSD